MFFSVLLWFVGVCLELSPRRGDTFFLRVYLWMEHSFSSHPNLISHTTEVRSDSCNNFHTAPQVTNGMCYGNRLQYSVINLFVYIYRLSYALCLCRFFLIGLPEVRICRKSSGSSTRGSKNPFSFSGGVFPGRGLAPSSNLRLPSAWCKQ